MIGMPVRLSGKFGKPISIPQKMADNLLEIKEYFNNKRIFITGHTGFKGSWMLIWLKHLGAKVKGYALAPDGERNMYTSIQGDQLCQSIIADIRDKEKVKEEILNFEPDFIFHLAAQPLVRLSYDIPVETYETNVIGTTHILDALRFLKKPCVAIIITTDKVYANNETNYFYSEEDRLGGYDPYSASKAAAEIVIDSYRKSYFNTDSYDKHKKSVSVARAGNVIGGGDWAKDRIIPDIIRAFEKNEPVIIRNPEAVRPWQHVLEPLFGYIKLAIKQVQHPQKYSDAFNFGPEPSDNLTVMQVVNVAIQSWGKGNYELLSENNAKHEAGLLQLSIKKAKEKLNWFPIWKSNMAIEKTIDWYKFNVTNPHDLLNFSVQQLKQFTGEI